MCYVIITSGSLIWFLLSLFTDVLIISAIVTPKWLIGPESMMVGGNSTMRKYPSVGIYTRWAISPRVCVWKTICTIGSWSRQYGMVFDWFFFDYIFFFFFFVLVADVKSWQNKIEAISIVAPSTSMAFWRKITCIPYSGRWPCCFCRSLLCWWRWRCVWHWSHAVASRWWAKVYTILPERRRLSRVGEIGCDRKWDNWNDGRDGWLAVAIMMAILWIFAMTSWVSPSNLPEDNASNDFYFNSGISVLIGLLFHPMGWGEERVQRLCGPDAEAFWPGDCRLGTTFTYFYLYKIVSNQQFSQVVHCILLLSV